MVRQFFRPISDKQRQIVFVVVSSETVPITEEQREADRFCRNTVRVINGVKCSVRPLHETTIRRYENGTIYVPNLNRTYALKRYVNATTGRGNKVLVCLEPVEELISFPIVLTTGCLLVSIVSLVGHLIASFKTITLRRLVEISPV